MLSIAALVNVWRVALPNNGELPDGADDFGISLKDPQWYVVFKMSITRLQTDITSLPFLSGHFLTAEITAC